MTPRWHLQTPRHRCATALALAVPLGVAVALGPARAADPATPIAQQPPLSKPDAGPGRAQELEELRTEQKRAADTEAELTKEIDAIGTDRRQLNDDLISTAARIRALEERMSAAEQRFSTLSDTELRLGRVAQEPAERGGRNSGGAAAARPEPPAPHSGIARGRARQFARRHAAGRRLPAMQGEAERLASDLAELREVRGEMSAQREALTHDLAALTGDRQRLSLLIDERQKKLADTQNALEAAHQRATALARQADGLKDLIVKLEESRARGLEPTAPTAHGKDLRGKLAGLRDPGRLAPAIAFASAKGALPLPVTGVRLREFGAPDGLGGTEKGLWVASRPSAQVTSPCDGWVVFAGPFRSYGQLLILNAGDGYYVVLAGMERISVDVGQFVLAGEPVAVMGGGPQSAAAVTIGSNQPCST